MKKNGEGRRKLKCRHYNREDDTVIRFDQLDKLVKRGQMFSGSRCNNSNFTAPKSAQKLLVSMPIQVQ